MTDIRPSDRLFAPIERLIAALSDPLRRERTAIMVLAAYVAAWTLYGVLAKGSQDIHPDMAEIAIWSREPAFGYSKHPPLAPWLAAAWFALFPATDWSFYLLAMVVAGVALWIAWRLAGDYLDDDKRALALLLLMLVPFFNFHALKFNVNTVLMPMWGATALCFLRSFERRSAFWELSPACSRPERCLANTGQSFCCSGSAWPRCSTSAAWLIFAQRRPGSRSRSVLW